MFPTRRVSRYVPESARWLLTQGRKEEAIEQLQRAARVNKRSLPTDALDKVAPTVAQGIQTASSVGPAMAC